MTRLQYEAKELARLANVYGLVSIDDKQSSLMNYLAHELGHGSYVSYYDDQAKKRIVVRKDWLFKKLVQAKDQVK